ncbi:MAG: stage V sporulation protein AD [Clostridia bacterium]|nr:stage V sporulation protein AD [Clostridia bacterium]
MTKKTGKQTIIFNNPPHILSYVAVGGKEEAKGPLGKHFDTIFPDPYLGEASWEKAECKLQYSAVKTLLEKSNYLPQDIDIMFGGDLINQCTSSYFAARDLQIPLYGIYGACSTMAEALHLGCMAIEGDFAENIIAVTSSHFCSSEKQFRFPLEYGGQRPPTSQWTVTASGAVLVTKETGDIIIDKITTGKIVDKGITDANNMGAAMAPAAADTIKTHFEDTKLDYDYYDLIVTGDLGKLGKTLLDRLLKEEGIDLSERLDDCGCMIYNIDKQDKHCGGSGCGCSASVLASYILPMVKEEKFKKVLFVPTGALMSPLTCKQGESIAGVAHAVSITKREEN